MTTPALITLTYILAIAGIGAMFVPCLPSAIASCAALVCAHIAGAAYVDAKIIIYWSIATVIVLALRILQPAPKGSATAQWYIALGATAGAFVGYAIAPTAAAIIISSAIATFLGSVIYIRTPKARAYHVAPGNFVQFICATGLPAIVTASMSAIAIATVI